MGIFDIFKKNDEPLDYDPLDVKITDLKKGYVFDYDMRSWVVTHVYEYDWGNHYFTKEFRVDSGDMVLYLSVERDDELILTLTKKLNIRKIDRGLPEYIQKNEKPPTTLRYSGKTFHFDSESAGYFHEQGSAGGWKGFLCWDYLDDSEEFVLSIEQWGDDDFDTAYGLLVKETDITNIIPAE